MSTPQVSRLAHLDRRSWWLWAVVFAVLIPITGTVSFLYVRLLDTTSTDSAEWWIRDGYYAGIGLGGLVLLLCLYVAFKQVQLNRVRNEMGREHAELEDMRARLSEVSALFSTTTTLNLELKLEVILEIIVRRVVSTLTAQQASVMIYNPETGVLETRASYGLGSEFARNAKARLGEGIAGWVAQSQEAVLLGSDEPTGKFKKHYKSERQITSALSLPLRVGERCVGVLNVNRINQAAPFEERHRDMLRLFAEHVGSVIERAETMDRLAARTQALESSNLQLNEINRMKDVFLSTASHELKTPLTSVIAYAEVLRTSQDTLPPAQRDEFLRRLDTEANTLLSLIDDILDLSRLENGKLRLECHSSTIQQVIKAAFDSAEPMAQKHGVTLEQNQEPGIPELSLDEGKMRQVVVNLLTNAIKFSPEGGTVTVATRAEQEFVVIEVRDKGPGVKPEEQVQIFELFGQGRQAERKIKGLGIGLHLVKRITELHGGHVGVDSQLGKGSNFWIRLPIAPARELAQAA